MPACSTKQYPGNPSVISSIPGHCRSSKCRNSAGQGCLYMCASSIRMIGFVFHAADRITSSSASKGHSVRSAVQLEFGKSRHGVFSQNSVRGEKTLGRL